MTQLISEINGRLSFLFRYSSLLNYRTRKLLCSSLVQPFLDFSCSTWYSGIPAVYKDRLDVIQRRMVRFIIARSPRDHVDTSDLNSMSWMTVPNRVKYFKLLHMFRIYNGTCPSYLKDGFTKTDSVHGHNTRGSDRNFFVPKNHATNIMFSSFSATAVRHWNGLNETLKACNSLTSFRKLLKLDTVVNFYKSLLFSFFRFFSVSPFYYFLPRMPSYL